MDQNTNSQNPHKHLGDAIRDSRKDMGLSQEDFSELCDVHRTYVGAVERGEKNVSLANIMKIARALKTSAAELFRKAKL